MSDYVLEWLPNGGWRRAGRTYSSLWELLRREEFDEPEVLVRPSGAGAGCVYELEALRAIPEREVVCHMKELKEVSDERA